METNKKSGWGSPSDWGTAIGILIAVIGLMSLISSVWTPDASTARTRLATANGYVPRNQVTRNSTLYK